MLIHRQRGWLRSRSSSEAKPHLIGWRGAAAKLTACCDNTGQSDGMPRDCPDGLPRAWLPYPNTSYPDTHQGVSSYCDHLNAGVLRRPEKRLWAGAVDA